MGIKGSLFLSLLLHVSVLVAVMSFIPSYRKESDTVRISLSGVNIKEVPRQARVKRSSKRNKVLKKEMVKSKKRTIVKKKAERKPQKAVVRKKELKKEIIRREKVLTRSKEDKRKADKAFGKSKPRIEDSQKKQVLPVKESAPKTLHREVRDQIKQSPVESVKSYQEKYEDENLSAIREAILSYLKYPPIARRMGWEGTVIVRFTLLPDGKLEESGIERSSGHGILDRSALEAVRLAHRNFPKPKDRVTIVIPIVYKLE